MPTGNRRMVNPKIVDLDIFLDMPATARLLYYDLLVRADDDGFITPQRIVRMTGASQDDLKILIAKQFVYMWEDGIIVLLHWREHNHVQNDRYIPSDYYPRLRKIGSKYALGARQIVSNLDTKRIQSVSILDTQDRVGKDSKNNKEIYKESSHELSPAYQEIINQVLTIWNETNHTRLKSLSPLNVQNLLKKLQIHNLEDILDAIRNKHRCKVNFYREIGLDTLLRPTDKSKNPVDYVADILRTY